MIFFKFLDYRSKPASALHLSCQTVESKIVQFFSETHIHSNSHYYHYNVFDLTGRLLQIT